IHENLLRYDSPFTLDIQGRETRIHIHVRQGPENLGKKLRRRCGVIASLLLRRKRIEIPADSLHSLADLARGAPRSSLEQQMLNEMRDSALSGGLTPPSDTRPAPHGSRLRMPHLTGRHTHTIGKFGKLGNHDSRSSEPWCISRYSTSATSRG